MSNNLRAGGKLWTDATIAVNDMSADVLIGPANNVALFIKNGDDAAATFKVQVSGRAEPAAGRNPTITDWYDYQEASGTDFVLTVAAGDSVCYDFSPFSPSRLRLVCTAGTTPTHITAFVEANG